MTTRVARRLRRGIVAVATGITVLAVILVLAAWKDDLTIQSDMGVASAEVISAGSLRSAISFVTPDGVTHSPKLGVLYPTKLVAGQSIDVEYSKADPDLVRVAGRNASVAIIPAGSVAVITWLVAGAGLVLVRRLERR